MFSASVLGQCGEITQGSLGHALWLYFQNGYCAFTYPVSTSLSLLLSQVGILTTLQKLTSSILVSVGNPPSGWTQHLQFLGFLRFIWSNSGWFLACHLTDLGSLPQIYYSCKHTANFLRYLFIFLVQTFSRSPLQNCPLMQF